MNIYKWYFFNRKAVNEFFCIKQTSDNIKEDIIPFKVISMLFDLIIDGYSMINKIFSGRRSAFNNWVPLYQNNYTNGTGMCSLILNYNIVIFQKDNRHVPRGNQVFFPILNFVICITTVLALLYRRFVSIRNFSQQRQTHVETSRK